MRGWGLGTEYNSSADTSESYEIIWREDGFRPVYRSNYFWMIFAVAKIHAEDAICDRTRAHTRGGGILW